MNRKTIFSPCRCYRYTLWRQWNELLCDDSFIAFIGLNPSTADETHDDPTIRRCIGFAKRWGFGGLCMLNLFAFRATDPRQMMSAAMDPIGQENDAHIKAVAAMSKAPLVCAWGNDGTHLGRGAAVVRMLGIKLSCLGTTKSGQPLHPLYLKANILPIPYP